MSDAPTKLSQFQPTKKRVGVVIVIIAATRTIFLVEPKIGSVANEEFFVLSNGSVTGCVPDATVGFVDPVVHIGVLAGMVKEGSVSQGQEFVGTAVEQVVFEDGVTHVLLILGLGNQQTGSDVQQSAGSNVHNRKQPTALTRRVAYSIVTRNIRKHNAIILIIII